MREENIEIEVLPISEKMNRVNIEMFFEDIENLKGFIPKKLGDYIKEKYVFKTPNDTEKVHYYVDGIYKPGVHLIKFETRKALREWTKNYHISETVGAITQTTYIERDEVNSEEFKIPIENGLIDLKTLEIIPHTPKYFFTFKLPIRYEPDAKCPTFIKWLKERLNIDDGKDESPNQWKFDVIQEMFGYCLLKDTRHQKAFLLYGPRRAGKSTLLEILILMLGRENTNSYSLQTLTEDRFAIAYLHDKLANICADLSIKSLKNTGKFMMITGSDQMTAAKKRGHSFTFKPITKLIFSCNDIPRTGNKNLAFYRRWILIPFEKVIPEDEVEVNKKIELGEEISGVFNWAISGLKRLIKNKKFSYPFNETDVKDMYEKGSDSISSFIYNAVDEDDLAKIKKRNVYKCYKKYCEREGIRCEHQVTFGKVFREVTGCGSTTIKNIPSYAGVTLKTEWLDWLGVQKTTLSNYS